MAVNRNNGGNDGVAPKDSQQTQELVAAVHQLVESQHQEAEERRDERDLRRHEIDSNKEIALTSIAAQREYHNQHFTKYNQHFAHKLIFSGVAIVAVLIFFGFSIWMGAKEIVVELAKVASGLLLGMFGGYFWGKDKGAKDPGKPRDDS